VTDPDPIADAATPPAQPAGAPALLAVTVNGEPRAFSAGASALDAVTALGLVGRPLAVEINERIVPRRDLAAWTLADGDRLEIVTLVGGG
jgi:thiamine biosynthesis protein ThiS